MGFRGQAFAFDSPGAAVAAVVARVCAPHPARPSEGVGLTGATGRILAGDICTDRDSPSFDYAAMDGYAVCATDLVAPPETGSNAATRALTLPVGGESRIGEPPSASFDGVRRPIAVRIATGAPIPPGADAVIRREDVLEHAEERGGAVTSIGIGAEVAARIKRGDHIRRQGENAPAGAVVLDAGEPISAAGLATLAAVGSTRPAVFARLRIAVITTGDELVAPHHTPTAFQSRNSNAPAIRAILASQAWTDVMSASHIRDDGDLAGALEHAGHKADAVVLTGGVSMGHRDPVRSAVERVGAEIVFHGLPQRPGKPMLGAILQQPRRHAARAVPIFGLPGNPVSALVTCVRIVLPVLAHCAGARRTPPECLPRLVAVRNPDGRTLDLWWNRLVRLVVDADGLPQAELIDGRGSGDIVAAGRSDGFVEIPPGASSAILPYYAWPSGARDPVHEKCSGNEAGHERQHP